MNFNPTNTKWSVAEFDNSGKLGNFSTTPWEFHQESMNAGSLWVGGYQPSPGSDNKIACEIFMAGSSAVSDAFEVGFVTSDRFVGTKNGALYRFGKKI
jgi:hypothetical protein